MRLKVEFEGDQTIYLDKVSKFLIEADDPKPELPDFIQRKIDVKEDEQSDIAPEN